MEEKRKIVNEFIAYSNIHNDNLYGRGNDVSWEKQIRLCSDEKCSKIVLADETRMKLSDGKYFAQFYPRCCECGNIACEDHTSSISSCERCDDSFCNTHFKPHKCSNEM